MPSTFGNKWSQPQYIAPTVGKKATGTGLFGAMQQAMDKAMQAKQRDDQVAPMRYQGGAPTSFNWDSFMSGPQQSNPYLSGINSNYMQGNTLGSPQAYMAPRVRNPQAGTPMGRSSFMGSGGFGQGQQNMKRNLGGNI